jgi:hypothetical protein
MDQIEISISLSMSGASFQPATASAAPICVQPQQPVSASGPKMIPHSANYYGNNSASTTPTDLMECSTTLNAY